MDTQTEFRPNKHFKTKGKTKHIEFSENCIDWFIGHSAENLDVASKTHKAVHPGTNTKTKKTLLAPVHKLEWPLMHLFHQGRK